MPTVPNRSVIFKSVPEGNPIKNVNLTIEDRPIDPSVPPKGGFSYKVHYVSYDPYQRGRMAAPDPTRYVNSFDLNGPVRNKAIATVVSSDTDKFKTGDAVIFDEGDFAEYGHLPATHLGLVEPFNPAPGIDPKVYLGALGMPGLTAYASLYEIGKPKSGETIFISSAAGAVGSLVGQISKLLGLTVIGSVGSDEKVDYVVNDLGFDSAFNYKKEDPSTALARLAPKGLDIYFDNVGAEHLDAALANMNDFGRIVVCGMISQYNVHPTAENPEPGYKVKNITAVLFKRLTMRGFIVLDDNISIPYKDKHREAVTNWLLDGSLKARIDTTVGIENGIDGFLNLYKGNNKGKAVLQISPFPGFEEK